MVVRITKKMLYLQAIFVYFSLLCKFKKLFNMYCGNDSCDCCRMDAVLTAPCKCMVNGHILHIIKCLCNKSEINNERIV